MLPVTDETLALWDYIPVGARDECQVCSDTGMVPVRGDLEECRSCTPNARRVRVERTRERVRDAWL